MLVGDAKEMTRGVGVTVQKCGGMVVGMEERYLLLPVFFWKVLNADNFSQKKLLVNFLKVGGWASSCPLPPQF